MGLYRLQFRDAELLKNPSPMEYLSSTPIENAAHRYCTNHACEPGFIEVNCNMLLEVLKSRGR